MNWSISNHLTN